jgi:hypothetical protein
MSNLQTYPLDLSASAVSNKITDEPISIASDADRVFIPTGGPFFTSTLKVYVGDKLLTPIVDYRALDFNRDATLASRKEVCNAICITNPAASFKLTYQVIGGDYADLRTELIELINDTTFDQLKVLLWGSIIDKPTVFPPDAHSHYPYEWRGYTRVTTLLEKIRQAVVTSDNENIATVFDHIDQNIGEIVSDYLNQHGLVNIDSMPTDNGNVLLKGDGSASNPVGINQTGFFKELDARYNQNKTNPLSRIGAIADYFLPISAGFFNCKIPYLDTLSMYSVANVERNGNLLTLTPATNGQIIRYVYGYVRDWTNTPSIANFKPTNQQYRPPGLAANEEIMDLFGYNEQSMIGAIYTIAADGTATFKEHAVIWLNGTLYGDSHTLLRIGTELGRVILASITIPSLQSVFTYSPNVVTLRDGSIYLLFYKDASAVDVYKYNSVTKQFVQMTKWTGILQFNTIDPTQLNTVDNVLTSVESNIATAQAKPRPFAWLPSLKVGTETVIFDVTNLEPTKVTSYTLTPVMDNLAMNVRVTGDRIRCLISTPIRLDTYNGSANTFVAVREVGFTLDIQPLESVPTYRWIRHRRANDAWLSDGVNANTGSWGIYSDKIVYTVPYDLASQMQWNYVQRTCAILLGDGRRLNWQPNGPTGYPALLKSQRYSPDFSDDFNIDEMYCNYYQMKRQLASYFGNGATINIDQKTLNLPSPTVNAIDSTVIGFTGDLMVLQESFADFSTFTVQRVRMTAYRPSPTVISYPTTSNGTLQGYDTSTDRIVLGGDGTDGRYAIKPWVSAKLKDGTIKNGNCVFYRPLSGWVDQTVPCNVTVDWSARNFVYSENIKMTSVGYSAIEAFIDSVVAAKGTTSNARQWTLICSPYDPTVAVLSYFVSFTDNTQYDSLRSVKLTLDSNRTITAVQFSASDINRVTYNKAAIFLGDPRLAFSYAQWVIDYTNANTANDGNVAWLGRLPNRYGAATQDVRRFENILLRQLPISGNVNPFTLLKKEGTELDNTKYCCVVATSKGIGRMVDTVGYGVYRAFQKCIGANYASGSIYTTDPLFIFVNPRPPIDFSINVDDSIEVLLGGIYDSIEAGKLSLTDSTISDITDPKNRTVYVYVTLNLGKPEIIFRQAPIAESLYNTYIGKLVTDSKGILTADIQPVTRIGNYRPSATPRGSSFSVSSGTPDSSQLLNWDADVYSAGSTAVAGNVISGIYDVPGSVEFMIGDGEIFDIQMFGGGAGGGNSSKLVNADYNGKNGTDTEFYVNGVLVISAKGGLGGKQGQWTSDTVFANGAGGAGGKSVIASGADFALTISKMIMQAGGDGGGLPTNHTGGSSYLTIAPTKYGNGGKGADWNAIATSNGNGGGGGAGGYAAFRAKNTTGATITIRFVIGAAGGPGGTGTYLGNAGVGGAVSIQRGV